MMPAGRHTRVPAGSPPTRCASHTGTINPTHTTVNSVTSEGGVGVFVESGGGGGGGGRSGGGGGGITLYDLLYDVVTIGTAMGWLDFVADYTYGGYYQVARSVKVTGARAYTSTTSGTVTITEAAMMLPHGIS